jgi:hypothetical protein
VSGADIYKALPAAEPLDDFRGDTEHLRVCMKALLDMDARGVLVPHGVGGHARKMLSAAYCRLPPTEPAAGKYAALLEALLELISAAKGPVHLIDGQEALQAAVWNAEAAIAKATGAA